MNDYDEKTFAARISDLIALSERRGMTFTHFLNERQRFTAETELRRLGHENYCFYGGIENADRTMLCVFSDYCCPKNSDFPLSCITFKYKSSYKLSHRDFLGALTSLNIKRETIGDIIVGNGLAQVFTADTVRDTILFEITKIGSVGVSVTSEELPQLDKSSSYREISGTVASLRLDCILSLALGKGRSHAADAALSGAVEINYKPAQSGKIILKEKDIFSVRGHGKYRLEKVSGVSKKGRIHIVVLKYC
ncbi:MAG: YlmH/Sll1252 family protein [Clostridium sp.]|nr:YlmH/Sll1252 family protein [Clostridium sp.]MCM1547595.1 YlmH/Sll1252 family protein [Ruminococcus sp.]